MGDVSISLIDTSNRAGARGAIPSAHRGGAAMRLVVEPLRVLLDPAGISFLVLRVLEKSRCLWLRPTSRRNPGGARIFLILAGGVRGCGGLCSLGTSCIAGSRIASGGRKCLGVVPETSGAASFFNFLRLAGGARKAIAALSRAAEWPWRLPSVTRRRQHFPLEMGAAPAMARAGG